MEASLAFYCGLLRLRAGNSSVESGPELEQIMGIPHVRLDSRKLLTDSGDTRLELIEFLEPKHVRSDAKHLSTVGITHFAITVSDLESMHEEMHAAGVQFISPPEIEATGFAKVAFCRDPDGNLIEMIEVQRRA